MQEVLNQKNYEEYKAELDGAMHQAADAFVKIGYLLRIAKDTDILAESRYKNINEMAKEEYGLSPDQVSRYISINERFSENGYSERLKDGMKGYGIAKLQIMLTMSDEVVEVIPPETTKAELTEVQKEIKEELKKTDIEVILEDNKPPEEESILRKFLKAYFEDNTEKYKKLYESIRIKNGSETEKEKEDMFLDAVVPSGIGIMRARIPGTGMMMLTIRGEDNPAILLNVRTNEKTEYEISELTKEFAQIFVEYDFIAEYRYMEVYKKEWPKEEEEKEKIEPVQEKREEEKETYKEENTKVEVVEGVYAEIEDTEKAEETAKKEILKAEIIADGGQNCKEDDFEDEFENEKKKEDKRKNALKEMKHCVNNALANAEASIKAGAYKAALSDVEHLEHYIRKVIEMEVEE